MAAEVPAELRDPAAEVWQSAEGTEAWLTAHGMKPGRKLTWGPASRWEDARDAWAFANGYVILGPREVPKVDGNRLRSELQIRWTAPGSTMEWARAIGEGRPGAPRKGA